MEDGGRSREVVVSALQFACSDDVSTNLATAERLVRVAHAKGANIVLIQELFEGYYFCQAQREDFFRRAKPYKDHPTIARMQKLAKELGIVIPVSFFEEANNAHFNSIAVIDADGTDLGLYRKSHIPDGPGYQEKFYFNPGDTGFKVFQTKFAKIGVAICWDQWFPEAARAMVLQGAEILFYPTAIGSEPQDSGLDSRDHWKRVMQGHAGANVDGFVKKETKDERSIIVITHPTKAGERVEAPEIGIDHHDAAGPRIDHTSDGGEPMITPRDRKQEMRMARFFHQGMQATKFLDRQALNKLGPTRHVETLMNNLGWDILFELREFLYNHLSVEFLSSYDSYFPTDGSLEQAFSQFRILGREYRLNMRQLAKIFGFRRGTMSKMPRVATCDPGSFWRDICAYT